MEAEFSLTSEVKDGCLVITTDGYVNNKGCLLYTSPSPRD